MAGDLAALRGHLDALARLAAGDVAELSRAGAAAAKREGTAVANDVTGGDGRLSHLGRRGVRLGVGYDVSDGGQRVVLRLRPPGAWVLVERGAKPHMIDRRGRRKAPVLFGAGWAHPVPTPVHHPGAPGRSGVTRAFGRMRPEFTRAFHAAELARLGAIFSG